MILKVHLPVFFFNLALPFSVDSSFSFLAFSSAASLSSHSLSSRSVLRSNQRPKAANGSNFLNQLDFLLFPDSLSFTTSGFSSLSLFNVSELATASFTLSAGSLFLLSLLGLALDCLPFLPAFNLLTSLIVNLVLGLLAGSDTFLSSSCGLVPVLGVKPNFSLPSSIAS